MEQKDRAWKVAVVGAGPAGVYASDILLKRLKEKASLMGIPKDVHIDIFEKNSAPYGLVRYGVAPDHPAIKLISQALDRAIGADEISLYCNVCCGRDISLEDLLPRYDAVIFATGGGEDGKWELGGKKIKGVCGAGEVAGWYNCAPDFAAPPLSSKAVAIVGGGNTALDVARMLLQDPYSLSKTDMPFKIWSKMVASSVREVHIFIRRGVEANKFSPQQIRQLKACSRLILDDFSKKSLEGFNPEGKIAEEIKSELETPGPENEKKSYMHFSSSVSSLFAPGGKLKAVEASRNIEGKKKADFCLKTNLCISAVGWRSERLPGLPFDESKGVIANEGGRVAPKVYVSGWAKRGCDGLIGSTKADASQTVDIILSDWQNLKQRPIDDSPVEDFLLGQSIPFTRKAGWFVLEAYEADLGKPDGKRSVKVGSEEEMKRISSLAQ